MKKLIILSFLIYVLGTNASAQRFNGGNGNGYASAELNNVALSVDESIINYGKLFPNPASEFVRLEGAIEGETLVIVGENGFMQIRILESGQQLTISGLSPGVYFICDPALTRKWKLVKN